MGNTSQAGEWSLRWEGIFSGVPWSPPSLRGQKRGQRVRWELVQAPKTPLDKRQGKAAEDVVLKPGWQITEHPQQEEEKSSPARNRCQNELRDNGISATSAQRSATNPWVSFTPKSWQPFPAPGAKSSSALSQAPTLLLANCHCHPTYFRKHSSLNYPLPTLDLLGLVWAFFFFFPLFPCAFGTQSLQGRLHSSLWHLTCSSWCIYCSELLCELH